MPNARPTGVASFETPEQRRLQQLYEGLREKLLDLTKRNRMLNYSFGSRSKRHLQIIDEVPEEVYRLLVGDNASLEMIALQEPDDIPADEKTEEFLSEFEHARISDVEYLTRLAALESNARDDDQAIRLAENDLRERLRAQLGMPPRPKRIEINRNEHARRFGIDANPELPKNATKKSHGDKKLQTLKFPEELETVLEKIADGARLAEQEMGLSTLFLSFGFLEWYESDSSEKKFFAPLLLLPIKLEVRKVQGRKVFSIVANAGSVEANLSLQKYLERVAGRSLPDFEPDDEESAGSIEAYLSQVQKTVEGLNRWCVRRWLVLGHFAFGRLAMYADLAADKWQQHPSGQRLVESILRGTQGGDGNALPSIPEDYSIDDPEVENIAPFLIHDADASQHSALIDVAKGQDLVVQGPPGTGKSQTITNIIANTLAAGKSVLFLSEKQAALEVVKRRLDQAGLGEFCLEVHSDKSSSKQIIASLKRRIDLGLEKSKITIGKKADLTWLDSRKEVTDYLNALHTVADDGQTPFKLMWRSIRGRSTHRNVMATFKKVELPSAFLAKPSDLPGLLGKVEGYATSAQSFKVVHGSPSKSPWAHIGIASLPNYEISAFIDQLSELKELAKDLLTLIASNGDILTSPFENIRRVAAAGARLEQLPDDGILAQIVALDLDGLENVLELYQSLGDVSTSLRKLPILPNSSVETISSASKIVTLDKEKEFLELEPIQIFDKVTRRLEELQIFAETLKDALPALAAIGFDSSSRADGLEAVATAVIIASKLDVEHRPWLNQFHGIDHVRFETLRERWHLLLSSEHEWRARCGVDWKSWPTASEIANASEAIGRSAVGKLIGKIGGSAKIAQELIQKLGFVGQTLPTSEELAALAAHVQTLEAFVSDVGARRMMGRVWAGLSTPFDEVSVGLKVRDFMRERLSRLPEGETVARRVVALSVDELGVLASHEKFATAFRMLVAPLRQRCSGMPLRILLIALEGEIAKDRRIVTIDPERNLADIKLPLKTIDEIAKLKIKQQEIEEVLSRSPLAPIGKTLSANQKQYELAKRAIEWVRSIGSLDAPASVKEKLLGPSASLFGTRLYALSSELQLILASFEQRTIAIKNRSGIDISKFSDLEELERQVTVLITKRDELLDYVGLIEQRESIEKLGLKQFLDTADAIDLEPVEIPSLLSVLFAHTRADQERRRLPSLGKQAGLTLDTRRQAFAERDRRKISADRLSVLASLLPARPLNGNDAGPRKTWTEMALLRNELQKQQKFIPIRLLFGRAHRSLQTLMPCFMMSPLSLAKFLPAGQIEFDIVVIDEASQMKPEDALGGLLRAKQIVVVGDPKQLPPTDFFNRTDGTAGLQDDDEEYEDVDDESILEACQKAFRQVRRLKWHYRSRCESLIAFSNREFYDNSLITFPMARPSSFSVDLVRVNGAYQGRQNVAEALRVAEEAISLMRHYSGYDDEKLPTIGIVAVNIEQRDLIQEELRRLAVGDELVDEYFAKAEKRGEPVFVKNLENVQGDERDYILISLTYGREPGAMALKQRFGPINGKQGHRRLNVLFSRARQRIGLFASFGSSDVRPTERSHEGVRVLRRYLEYVEGRGRAAVDNLGVETDSDFELEVADRLRARGYTVDYQVGVSGFRIDLGVRHPQKPETFLVGIECDGARYHSSKSARDRDRLREEVLCGLGWTLLRVWSTDWFENPEGETNKLVQKIENFRIESSDTDLTSDYRFLSAVLADEMSLAPTSPISEIAIERESGALGQAGTAGDEPIEAVPINGADTVDVLSPVFAQIGVLTAKEGAQALREFREAVIAKEMFRWVPEQSILRDGMIETFVNTRLRDSNDWFKNVPQYLRQNTNSLEKKRYLDRICEIVGRIEVSV